MIAKHALIVACRDLLLTIFLIRRPFAIPTAGVTATIDSVQPFYPVCIGRFSTKRRRNFAREWGVSLCRNQLSRKCFFVQLQPNVVRMKRRKIGVRRPDEREFEICNPPAGCLVSNLYRRVDYQTTDIMCRAVTLSGIASDIVNALSNQCFGKFAGEPDK